MTVSRSSLSTLIIWYFIHAPFLFSKLPQIPAEAPVCAFLERLIPWGQVASLKKAGAGNLTS